MEYKKYIDKELQTEETTMRGGATEIIEVLKYLSGSNRNLGSYTVNLKANTAGVKEALAELEQKMLDMSRRKSRCRL